MQFIAITIIVLIEAITIIITYIVVTLLFVVTGFLKITVETFMFGICFCIYLYRESEDSSR